MTIKVAQISTSTRGGAAIAAQQISQLLNHSDIESTLITRNDLKDLEYSGVRRIVRSLLGKLLTIFQSLTTMSPFGIATPISISNIDVKKLIQQNFDVIHIHNWYNILSINDLRHLSKEVPLVFTLHDERLITGGCHITLGCDRFITNCGDCPAVRFKSPIKVSKSQLKEFLTQSNNLSVISPSQWIIDQVKRSGLDLNLKCLAHIPNFTSAEYVNPMNPVERAGSSNKLLFISANLAAEVKGLIILLEALELLTDRASPYFTPDIELHLVGEGNLPIYNAPNLKIIQHGFQTESRVREIISDSNFLIVPSLSENSPYVIVEAQLMGLPVIASNVAGIPELIEDSVTGFLSPLDPESMARTLIRAISSPVIEEISSKARRDALIRNDALSISQAHLEVYRKALSTK